MELILFGTDVWGMMQVPRFEWGNEKHQSTTAVRPAAYSTRTRVCIVCSVWMVAEGERGT